jgi:hypothetical protein
MLASDRITKEGVVAAQENADKQKTANDKLTKSVVNAATEIQQMAVDIQTMVLPQLANFASYSAAIVSKLKGMLNEFGGGEGGAAESGFFENIGNKYGATIGAGLGGGAAVAAAPFTGGGSMLGLATSMGVGYGAGSQYGGATGKWLDKTFGTGGKGKPAGAPTNGVVPQIPTGLIPGGRQGTGLIDPSLQDKLALVMQAFPGSRITSLNDSDNFNRDPTDVHARGRAMDFVPADFDPKRVDEYIKTLRSMGFSHAQFEKKGQVNPNGSVATGDHIHAQLANGGNLGAGQTAIVGEKGPEIIHGPGSVTSTAATSKIFGEMLDRLEEMVDVLKDNRDYSEKILHATQ